MDLSSPNSTTNSPLVPVFGDNVQDLLGTGALNVNPSAIITVNSTNDALDDSNSGVTTLRDAINQANADNGEDTIVFDRSLFSTAQNITLNLGELDITHNTSIIAPRDSLTGGDLVTVSGNNASRVFEIEPRATVNLSGLIVTDGKVTGDNGGGILNSGNLTLDSSIVRNGSARSGGGIFNNADAILMVSNSTLGSNISSGIFNSGTVEVSNSTLSGNRGSGILNSGTVEVTNSTISGSIDTGIYNSGTLEVNNSTISGNSGFTGGGIFNNRILMVSNSIISGNSGFAGGGISNAGTMTVSNSTISGNSVTSGIMYAGAQGGGIYNAATMTVSNSTISGNSAKYFGGGIYNEGKTLTMSNSTLSNNSAQYGGGIFNSLLNSDSSTVKVRNSTLGGNSATYDGGGIFNGSGSTEVSNSTFIGNTAGNNGGGIFNGKLAINPSGIYNGIVTVSNTTLSGNSAGNNGGGISNSKTLTLVFSTLKLNQALSGGGVFLDDSTSATVRNTIIAANLNSTDGVNPDVSGSFTSNGYNLIGDSTGSTGFDDIGDIVGTGDNPIDPRLAPLDFNGGPTQTLALLPDSPAIDAGDPTVLDTDPTTDQRGLARVVNGRADIGAFEFS